MITSLTMFLLLYLLVKLDKLLVKLYLRGITGELWE